MREITRLRRICKRTGALLLAVSLLCTGCGGNKATDIRLKKTEGSVGILNGEGESLSPEADMKLYSGYAVSTRKRSHAWINLDNVKLAKMDASSQIEIQKSGKDLEILVNEGKLYFHVTEPLEEDETMSIRTSTMAVGIRGTCGWVEATGEKQMKVYILEGTVECSISAPEAGQRMTATVSGGEMAKLSYTEDGKADISVEPFTEENIEPFVREELEQDEELRNRIREASGLDISSGGEPGSPVSQALAEIDSVLSGGMDGSLRDRIGDREDLLTAGHTGNGAAELTDLFSTSQDELVDYMMGGKNEEGMSGWMKPFVDALSAEPEEISAGGRSTDYMQIRMGSGINCYKPNIYLYGEAGTALALSFLEPELLTATLPAYRESWQVEIGQDGRLTVDGEAGYPFLFYESVTIPGIYQKEEGFLVRAQDRKMQFEKILEAYGLNGQERADFIEFWDEKLDKEGDYVMYPQTTEAVDNAMPIQIDGAQPDHYFRLWFCFQKVEDGVVPAFELPDIVPASHERTALVEWGGMILP